MELSERKEPTETNIFRLKSGNLIDVYKFIKSSEPLLTIYISW